jgi:hypothetical protein
MRLAVGRGVASKINVALVHPMPVSGEKTP